MKSSEAKLLLQELERLYPGFLTDSQSRQVIEEILVDDSKLFFLDNKPFVILTKNTLIPSLMNEELLKRLPSVIIDMGAIPHICNGADIMRPGVKKIQGRFDEGDVLLVKDIKYGKPIGVCVAELSSESMRVMPKGKAALNMHYVGDRFWEIMKSS